MSASHAKRLIWLLDALACIGLVSVAALQLSRAGSAPQPGAPWWSANADAYLFGPDAGEWAMQAAALATGNFAELDAHRMPTWTILTVAAMRIGNLDVVYAGHIVNKLLLLALGPALYGLGRAAGMRAGAVAVATLAVIDPSLVGAATRFGVDPTVTTLLPLSLLAAYGSGRWWWFAVMGGALSALLAASHLSALAYPLPALLMCFFNGKGWRRWAGTLLFAGGTAATLYAIYQVFPFLPEKFLVDAFAEGIQPTAAPTDAQVAASRDSAVALVLQNAPGAAATASAGIASSYGPKGVPWQALVAIPLFGIWGAAAFTSESLSGRFARLRQFFSGWAVGFPLLAACAPLVLFAAGELPARYSQNVLPIGGLVFFRGLSFWVAGAAKLAGRPKSPLSQVLTEAALLATAFFVDRVPPPQEDRGEPPPAEARALHVGRALAAHFPPGIEAASPLREALPYAGQRYCPDTVCPSGPGEREVIACIAVLRNECAGTGDIPFVVAPGMSREQEGPFRLALTDWIEARLDPVTTVGDVRLYALPRQGELLPPGNRGPTPEPAGNPPPNEPPPAPGNGPPPG